MLVGPVGLYIRRKLNETPEFLASTHTRTPVRELFATEKTGLIVGAGLVAVGTASTYFSIYMPTYATTHLHLPPATGYIVTIVLSLLAMVLIPLGGNLADKIGYTRMMLPAAILMLLSFYPLFLFITRNPSLSTLLAGLIFNELFQDAYLCALAAVMAGIFPARTRVTGLSLSYNLGVTLFGGFAPAVFTWLIAVTHNTAAPSFYLMAMAVVSIIAVISVKRRAIHSLRQGEGEDIVTLFGAQLAVPTSSDHDVLLAVKAIAHGYRLPSCRELILPELRAGFDVKGPQI